MPFETSAASSTSQRFQSLLVAGRSGARSSFVCTTAYLHAHRAAAVDTPAIAAAGLRHGNPRFPPAADGRAGTFTTVASTGSASALRPRRRLARGHVRRRRDHRPARARVVLTGRTYVGTFTLGEMNGEGRPDSPRRRIVRRRLAREPTARARRGHARTDGGHVRRRVGRR